MALSTTGAPLDPGLTSASRDARLRTSPIGAIAVLLDLLIDLSGADPGLRSGRDGNLNHVAGSNWISVETQAGNLDRLGSHQSSIGPEVADSVQALRALNVDAFYGQWTRFRHLRRRPQRHRAP